MSEPTVQTTRGRFVRAMGLAALASCTAGATLASAMGTDTTSLTLAVATLAIVGILAMLPAFLLIWPCPASRFGTVVLAATMAQTLGAVALGALWTMTRSPDRVPFWAAIVAGTMVLLAIEVGYAITLLSRANRQQTDGASDPEAG